MSCFCRLHARPLPGRPKQIPNTFASGQIVFAKHSSVFSSQWHGTLNTVTGIQKAKRKFAQSNANGELFVRTSPLSLPKVHLTPLLLARERPRCRPTHPMVLARGWVQERVPELLPVCPQVFLYGLCPEIVAAMVGPVRRPRRPQLSGKPPQMRQLETFFVGITVRCLAIARR